ncbi:lysophospholipid acyltransferase family protein [Alienimonas californiensis]|uniref:Acyltransferase n=1 Tax=Alienimonas californiensis TaxID=2527989 RepID=A0A517P8K6_9PLAN|nr:lysophospholipid acyltransferase family protein [Alienimonas californiensis]QDT15708.1 Acyltransferase [Alienimonas californiensis]
MSAPPRTSRFLRWGFRRYVLGGFPFGKGMLARAFHAVRLLEPLPEGLDEEEPSERRAFYLNHPGWWDPLAAAALAERLRPGRVPVAPIDADVLRAAPVLGWLGVFGVERDAAGRATAAGAKTFLRTARAALDDPGCDLWLTPEGTFASPDARPLRFAPGLGRLVSRDSELVCVPVAVRYDFWTERRPELLLAVGAPVRLGDVEGDRARRSAAAGDAPVNAGECSRFLEGRLEATLDALTVASASRDPARFRSIGRGASRPSDSSPGS